VTEIGYIRSSDGEEEAVLGAMELVNVSTYTYNRFHTTF